MVEFSTTIFGQGQCWCPWPTLPLKVTCMLMVCAAAWSHVDIQGLCCHRENWQLCDLCCHLRSCWCSWLVLLPRATMVSMALAGQKTLLMPLVVQETMLRSVAWSDTGEHVGVRGLCCFQKPCVSSCSVFLLSVMGTEVVFIMVLMTADSQLRRGTWNASVIIPIPPPIRKKNNSLSRKIIHWWELLKLLKMW